MATNTLIAAGTTATTSSDFTVPVGGELDLYLTASAGIENLPSTAEILIQKKSGSNYVTHLRLNKAYPSCKLKGAGPWRGKRGEQDQAIGLDSET